MSRLPLWLVVGALGVSGAVWVLLRLERRRGHRLHLFVEDRLASRLLVGHDSTLRRPLFWLTVAGCALMLVAFAQPRWGSSWQKVHSQSHDIIVCLDTSESMNAENPLPTRIDRAKQKIVSLMDLAQGDRFALISFSGAAELMCPLTLDQGYYRSVLNAVDTDSISLEGTDIAAALELAIKVLRKQEEETGDYSRESRAVLLISDGEAITGDAVEKARTLSEFARVFVIGVGDPRGTEVRYAGALDARGPVKTHFSKLDESALERIAIEGHGAYKRSTPNNSDVDTIFDLIQKLSTRDATSDLRMRLVNRFQWPLALAILCFAAEGIWLAILPIMRDRSTRRGLVKVEDESGA